MSLSMENVDLTVEEGIAWITLDRPQQLNAFAEAMREELLEALMHVQENDAIQVAVITGAGRAFCAGGDVRKMVEFKQDNAGFEKLRPLLDAGSQIIRLLQEIPKPILAMVNGAAAGAGCNLALACDLRIASDNASFAQSFIKVGLHPDWGGTFFLPRLVGPSRALELMWTGRRVEAEEAEEIGLVHQVVPHAHLREHTRRLARRLAGAPTAPMRMAKLAVHTSLSQDLEGMLEFESEAQAECWASEESTEGIRAFAERRRPMFGGH